MIAALAAVGVPTATPLDWQEWRQTGLAAFDLVWRTINDSYYDPTFGGLDWNRVREDLRPRAEQAESPAAQRAAIREMLARLGESHFVLLGEAPGLEGPAGPASVPFDIRSTSAGLLVTRLHDENLEAVRPGDAIVQIDDVPVARLHAGLDPGDPRLAELVWRRARHALAGQAGSTVRLVVADPSGQERAAIVSRVAEPGDEVTVGNLPPLRVHLDAVERRTSGGRQVGVIRFNVWMAAVAAPFSRAIDRFRAADGLIVDLRGNPGGLADMIRGVAGHLVDAPVVLGRMRMRGLDLEFRANPRRSTSDGRVVEPFSGPVAILVDGLTASASECFAGGLQALGRARVFGTSTAGQALPAATQQLPTGDVLLYAVGNFVTPDGRRLEGVGVVPDVEVLPTPASLAEGWDAEAAALAWIDRTPG